MLQQESISTNKSIGSSCVIKWSDSGRAFRIDNTSIFADAVLSKYFKTSKFSSFQRNLNLYGFFKVRRGPDTDMYAHPAFVRYRPDLLSQLRKYNPSAKKKDAAGLSKQISHTSSHYDSGLLPQEFVSNETNNKLESNCIQSISPSSQKICPLGFPLQHLYGCDVKDTKNCDFSIQYPVTSRSHYMQKMKLRDDFGYRYPNHINSKGNLSLSQGDKLSFLAMALSSVVENEFSEHFQDMNNVPGVGQEP